MTNKNIIHLPQTHPRQMKTISRRATIMGGAIAGLAGVIGLSGVMATPTLAASKKDLAILNAAIDLENQAIWAYGVAAPKLTKTSVGDTVLKLAVRNLEDHKKHRDALSAAVKQMGGTPSPAKKEYDLSSYIKAGEGNLDNDANIAKLALALEYDAALAYIDAFSQLDDRKLIAAAGTIGPDEAAHVTAIRAVFISLGVDIPFVPDAFVSSASRNKWVLKV
jgi:rubrerythrin